MDKNLMRRISVSGLDGLSDNDLADYYEATCAAWDLDSSLRPFEFMILNGKKVLYAKKNATDLLSAKLKLTRTVTDPVEVTVNGQKLLQAKCRVSSPDGRTDEDIATVRVDRNTENAVMVVITKAKRRATLSYLGIGMPDESELDQIPGALPMPPLKDPATNRADASLDQRIAQVASKRELFSLVNDVANAPEYAPEFAAKCLALLKKCDDTAFAAVLAEMDKFPATLKEHDTAWKEVREYISNRMEESHAQPSQR